MTIIGLKRVAVLSEVTDGHVVSLDFLIDRLGSSDNFVIFRDDFVG